jgi:hypothetical protein
LPSRRSGETTVDGEKQEAPKIEESIDPSSIEGQSSDHEESDDLVGRVDPPTNVDKRPRWLRDTLKDAEGHSTPKGTFRERRPTQRFSNYVPLMSNIINSKPSSFEEAAGQQVWKDAMMEEYHSIMKNDVWDIVLRPKGKSGDFQVDLSNQT